MIKKISFENYKAFDKGEIRIEPITILLGANSVGKSSIIQLLLLLQQTALSDKYKSALRLNGQYVSLGENENLFKDKDTSKELIINLQFEDNSFLDFFKELQSQLISSVIGPIKFFEPYYYHSAKNLDKTVLARIKKLSKNLSIRTKQDFLKLIEECEDLKKSLPKRPRIFEKEFMLFEDSEIDTMYNQKFEYTAEMKSIYCNMFDLLTKASDLNNTFDLSFSIANIKSKLDNVLKVTRVKLQNNGHSILDIILEIDKSKKCYSMVTLNSAFVKSKSLIDEFSKKQLLTNLNYDSTLFYLFSTKERERFYYDFKNNSIINNIISNIFYKSIKTLRNIFGRELVNYVSPLRAHPKRYYFLDKAKINTSLDTLDGDSLTEILKENKVVKSKVNKWLKKFDLSVDVDTLQDVIHKLKVRQSGLSLDITDVGFGISQVLPVIVQGFLSFSQSLTIIEQPEIHLHPKMQADLADLFIDVAFPTKGRKSVKYLLIETHSEYLLKRLRRRLSESKGELTSNVAIYFFNPKNDSNTGIIEEKKINENGAFDWPPNFYSGELLKDTIEFIKNQK